MDEKIIRLACGAYRKFVPVWQADGSRKLELYKERIRCIAGPVGKLP